MDTREGTAGLARSWLSAVFIEAGLRAIGPPRNDHRWFPRKISALLPSAAGPRTSRLGRCGCRPMNRLTR